MNNDTTGIWSEIRTSFLRGIGVLIPLGMTYWVFSTLLNWMDGFLSPVFERLLGRPTPGLGFLSMLLIILLVGLLTKNLIGHLLFTWFERLIGSIPFVRVVYGAIKDLIGAVAFGGRSKTFREVVMVEYPRPGLFCVGFVTNEMTYLASETEHREFINVYIPNPPNPTSGFLVLVPIKDVVTLDLSIEEGLKLVLSGGIVVPERLAPRTSSS
jgi:uncharacterized membrane protein